MNRRNSSIKHLDFLLIDLISLLAAFSLAFRIHFGDFSCFSNLGWRRLWMLMSLIDIIISLFISPYSGIFRRSYYRELGHVIRLTIYNFLATSLIFYLFKIGAEYSRMTLVLTYALYFIFSFILKYILKKILISFRKLNRPNLFIVTDSKNAEKVIANICAADFQLYNIRGVFLTDEGTADIPSDIPLIHENFTDFILRENINEVLISVPPTDLDTYTYESLVQNGVTVYFDIDIITDFHPEVEFIRTLGITRALGIGNFAFSARQDAYLVLKRIIDIMIGLIGSFFLLPLGGIIKLIYRLSGDTAKILYTQERIGKDGRKIHIFKFRSMVPDAEAMLKELLKEDKYRIEWEENQKLTDDPRITKVGSFLRRTSMDELPQLFNVLKGEMSIVGPRPLVEGELEAHNGLKLYQKVRPGITGWWGCNGRSNISYRERLELEYYYVKHVSLGLDLLCIFRTFFSVIKREGAQ